MNEAPSKQLSVGILEKVRYSIALIVVLTVYFQGKDTERDLLTNAFISLMIILLIDFLMIIYHQNANSNLIQRRFLYLLERSNNSFGNIPHTFKTYLSHNSSFKEMFDDFNAVLMPLLVVLLLYAVVIVLPIVIIQMVWAVFLFLFYGVHWIATMVTARFTDSSKEISAAGTSSVAIYCFVLYGIFGLATWLFYELYV
jgi:predicted RND superfamily exporter protein